MNYAEDIKRIRMDLSRLAVVGIYVLSLLQLPAGNIGGQRNEF